MRRHRRRKNNKIIIVTSVLLILGVTAGYAAFSTNLNINVKANIYDKKDLCYKTSDNGDGTVTITDYNKECGSDVVIPEKIKGKKVTKIGYSDYNGGKSFNHKELTSVVIPDTVETIGMYAFYGNKISSLDLGDGVKSIAAEVFSNNLITEVSFPPSLKTVGRGAFKYNKLTSIPNLRYITNLGGGAFAANQVPAEEAIVYGINSDGSINYEYLNSYAGPWISNLTLPEGIKIIDDYSMRGVNCTTLTLPNSIEKIETAALMQVYINTINIPSNIKIIEDNAMSQSPYIKVVNIDRKENAIEGSPWGAVNATINWTGTN